MREISPFEDGDFTIEKFEERHNADLAKGIGNLQARVLKLSKDIEAKLSNKELEKKIKKVKKDVSNHLESLKFNEALKSIWELIAFCDQYIEKEKPWEGGKDSVIADLLFALLEIGQLLRPFLPETAEKIINKQEEALFPRI